MNKNNVFPWNLFLLVPVAGLLAFVYYVMTNVTSILANVLTFAR